jgi:hypothetical protein
MEIAGELTLSTLCGPPQLAAFGQANYFSEVGVGGLHNQAWILRQIPQRVK